MTSLHPAREGRGVRAAWPIVSLILLWSSVASPVHAADPEVAITTRDGERVIVTLDDFDNKRQLFKLKSGKKKQEVGLGGIARIEFAPYDTLARPLVDDTLDVFTFRDGAKLKGVFRDANGSEVNALMGQAQSEQKYAFKLLRSIDLSATPLEVDRRIWGRGGFEFLNNMIESSLSSEFAASIEADEPLLEDPEIEQYLKNLGQSLAARSKRPDLEYTFKVVNRRTMNAFTVGGGHVYVYRGLLESLNSEAELAGVLGHEIGHNVGRHTVRALYKNLLAAGLVGVGGELLKGDDASSNADVDKLAGVVTEFITSKYSRDDEREADYLGFYNVLRTGYDPHGMVSVFETLNRAYPDRPDFRSMYLASHPSNEERIENVGAELDRIGGPRGQEDSPAFHAMRKRLMGLPRPMIPVGMLSDTLGVDPLAHTMRVVEPEDTTVRNLVLRGFFKAQGGSGNDVRMLMMRSVDYLNYKNGHPFTTIYDSGKLTAAEFRIKVPTKEPYIVVLDNTFSLMTPKVVIVQAVLEGEE